MSDIEYAATGTDERLLHANMTRAQADSGVFAFRVSREHYLWLGNEIARLRAALLTALCPGGGYTGQPKGEYPTTEACLRADACGCDQGAALKAQPSKSQQSPI